jgi:hypothetical protein
MPTPAPPSPNSTNPTGAMLHSVWNGFATEADQHPWLVPLVALVVLAAMVRAARVAIHSGPRDATRCFSRADKNVLLARAGNRCEHHGLFGGRCRSTERLEADHVHPWSRGGWTNVNNGQILCRSHNGAKSAAIPWDRSLRKLAERRAAYYPSGTERNVLRRAPKAVRARS